MADVQLEHGYLKIANALDEAILVAPFTGTQIRIVHCIVRLTYGWRQGSFRMSRPEIAERCGVAPVGGFLRAFDELIREGVIVEVERPFSRSAGAYSINKDFEHWGRFSVAVARLEALFRKRPPTAGRPTPQGSSSIEECQTPEGESSDVRQTLQGHRDRPSEVPQPDPIGSPKTPEVVDSPPLASAERQERHRNTEEPPPPRARESQSAGKVGGGADDEIKDYALRLTSAANQGIEARWGEQPNALGYGQSRQLAADLILAKVPLEVAVQSIADQCHGKRGEKPGSVEYFRLGIIRAKEVAEQKAFDAINPRTAKSEPSEPTRLHVDVAEVTRRKQQAERSETQLGVEYDAARKSAVTSWAKANPTKYAAIVQAATEEWREFLDTRTGKRSRDATIAQKCGEAAAFPSFDAWKRNRAESVRVGASLPNMQKTFGESG